MMQQVEEKRNEDVSSFVAYLNLTLWSSIKIISMDDYRRAFHGRSQLYVYCFHLTCLLKSNKERFDNELTKELLQLFKLCAKSWTEIKYSLVFYPVL